MAPSQPSQPADEVIATTFNVFCGPHTAMDEVHFEKFCRSSGRVHKRSSSTAAKDIFVSVVENSAIGMNLSEFKTALSILVEGDTKLGTPKRRPARNISRTWRWRPEFLSEVQESGTEDNSKNVGMQSEGLSKHPKCSSPATRTLRWRPADFDDMISVC
mmetsp:Transcript_58723/g.102776  ORF Transcript_58723/g.102776 Transcript_58723/m.102776 type:complete len:159 (-) Transcript_58723:144-620(-)